MKITTKKRNELPKSEFGIPSERKYPMDTKNRAANAKARASEQYIKGNLSGAMKTKIDNKANKVLKRARGK
jgi:hypothetical protein